MKPTAQTRVTNADCQAAKTMAARTSGRPSKTASGTTSTEPLRLEAERRWEEADQQTSRVARRKRQRVKRQAEQTTVRNELT